MRLRRSTARRPYADRRRYLAQCLLPSQTVQPCTRAGRRRPLRGGAASGFEGVIGKRKDSRYEAGKRSGAWLKVKPTRSADFVVGGYTRGKGARGPLGALLLGYWEGGKLRYASHVGSGFDDRTLKDLKARLEPLKTAKCPFAEKPPLNAPTTWVEPKVVAEVTFANWTPDGALRAPVFLRLRDEWIRRRWRKSSPSPRPSPKQGRTPRSPCASGQQDERFTLAIVRPASSSPARSRVWP